MRESYLFKIILGEMFTSGQLFLLNYQGFRNNQVNLYEFFLFGMLIKLKF
jgi:hypothetical protein